MDAEQLDTLRQWVRKAEEDWVAAEYLAAAKNEALYRPACFHAQQSAEKYLKALLVARGIAFPRTHNLEQLLVLVENTGEHLGEINADRLGALTPHAVSSRYPDDFEPVDLAQAQEALEVAGLVRTVARGLLPVEAFEHR